METVDDVIKVQTQASNLFGDPGSIWDFLFRYGVNMLVIIILVRFIYYPRHKNKDFLFTFILFNTVNFLICFLLSGAKLKMGFAFGLFAIFSILRYRTVTVPIREMGYFFVCVTLGLINSLTDIVNNLTELGIANGLILGLVLILDRQYSLEHENFKEITYERIDLIVPERREELLEDLRKRTGLPVRRIEIVKIDFLRDVAKINAFYLSRENESVSVGLGGDDD